MDSVAEELGILCGKQLPLVERLGHAHWKVRQLAYHTLRSEFISSNSKNGGVGDVILFSKYAPILMGECMRESHPEAFGSLLDTILYYVKDSCADLEVYGRHLWKLNKFIKNNSLCGRFNTEHQRTIVHILVQLRELGAWEIMPTFAIDGVPMICKLLDTAAEMHDSTEYLNEAVQHLAAWARNVDVRKRSVITASSGHAGFLKLFNDLCDADIGTDSNSNSIMNRDECVGESLLFRPSQQYSLLTEVSTTRNLDSLKYWESLPPTRASVANMDTPELSECIAAYILHYNARNAHRYISVRDCLCDFFDRQSITGKSLVGDFRLSEDTFVSQVLGAFERNPRIKRRLGDLPTLRRLYAALEKDHETMEVEEEEFDKVSDYNSEMDQAGSASQAEEEVNGGKELTEKEQVDGVNNNEMSASPEEEDKQDAEKEMAMKVGEDVDEMTVEPEEEGKQVAEKEMAMKVEEKEEDVNAELERLI